MSGVMMLEHLHEDAIAKKVQAAYDAVLAEGKTLTKDLAIIAEAAGEKREIKVVGTSEFADAIIAKMK